VFIITPAARSRSRNICALIPWYITLDPESGVEAGVQIRKKLSEWVYRFGAIRSDPAVHEMPFGVVGYAVVAIL
jgi:hypothetical protein